MQLCLDPATRSRLQASCLPCRRQRLSTGRLRGHGRQVYRLLVYGKAPSLGPSYWRAVLFVSGANERDAVVRAQSLTESSIRDQLRVPVALLATRPASDQPLYRPRPF